jgi:hypothetical protein
MEAQIMDDLQAEAPPSKRARLEESQNPNETPTPIDIMDDIYSTGANTPVPEALKVLQSGSSKTATLENSTPNMKGIPGLGLLGDVRKNLEEAMAEGKAQ